MNNPLDDRARRAESETKIFNNRVKVILFLLAVGIGVLTIVDKFSSLSHNPAAETGKQRIVDSGSTHPAVGALSAKRHHPRSEMNSATGADRSEHEQDGKSGMPPVARTATPLQTTELEDIEFKLLSAEGNSRAQTIKMTVLLTNHAANRYIWSAVESISDADGNEYMLRSFTNGASAYDNHIPLDTEVPRKCTYTFAGVLPGVKLIKLFKFRYRHKSLDDPDEVPFRDIPINWK